MKKEINQNIKEKIYKKKIKLSELVINASPNKKNFFDEKRYQKMTKKFAGQKYRIDLQIKHKDSINYKYNKMLYGYSKLINKFYPILERLFN